MGHWIIKEPKQEGGSVNKVMLMGRIGGEIETKLIGEITLAKFSMATSKKVKGSDVTQWHQVTAWGKVAETVFQYTGVGKRVLVEGEIEYRTYDKKDGTKGYATDIVARNISIIDFKEKGEGQSVDTSDIPF